MKLIFTSLLVSTFVGLQVSAVETPEAVDLGLSVKFASNALSVSQQGSFSSFYFGETEPPAAMNSPYSLEGVDLGSDISGTLYDAAHVILGREWRMPTEGEIQELIDKCVFEVATLDGRQGWTVTGTTGNSIFICSTGTSQGKPMGSYWTSTVNIDPMLFPKRAAMIMSLKGEELQLKRHEIGAFSLAILPVLNERQGKLVESLMVNADSINLKEGSTGHIYPRITPFDAADKDVKFTSSKADVATVSGTGLITAIAPGTAEITVETVDGSGISAVCRVTVEAKPVVERKVDLGLSVQWAAFNVGASTPSEAGDYYGYAEAVTRQNYNRYEYSHYEGWSFLPITADKPVYAGNRWEVKGQKIYMTGTPSDDAGYARGFVAKDLASNVATVNKITTSNFAVRPVRPVGGSVGIGSIESGSSVVGVFDILGVSVLRGVKVDKLGQLAPGIYVVRTADGKSFKVKL